MHRAIAPAIIGGGVFASAGDGINYGDFDALTWALDTTYDEVDAVVAALADVNDSFASFTGWTKEIEFNGTASASASGGTLTISRDTNNPFAVWTKDGTSVAELGATIEVDLGIATNNGGYNIIVFGFFNTGSDFIMVEIDVINDVARIVERQADGSFVTRGQATGFTFDDNFKASLSVQGTGATLRADASDGTTRQLHVDNIATANEDLSDFKYGIGISTASTTQSVQYNEVVAGISGFIARRDQTLVTYEDGMPYDDGSGNYYLVASLALVGEAARVGVFELDPTTGATTMIGQFVHNNAGSIYERIGAQLIYDRIAGEWKYFSSGFGPSGVTDGIRLSTTGSDPLAGGLFEWSAGTQLSLPLGTSGAAAYDPAVFWDGSVWRFFYSLTDEADFDPESFYPAMATSSDLSSFTLQVEDTGQSACEGGKVAKVGPSSWRVCYGTRSNIRVYDEDCSFVEALSLGTMASGVSPGHFMPWLENGNWHGIRFTDDTFDTGVSFTWGHFDYYTS